MIVAAAVCPAAPWLVPGVSPRLAERAADIQAAAVAAVATLSDVDRIVVVLPPPGRAGPAQSDRMMPERTTRPPSPDLLPPSGAARVGVCRSDRGVGKAIPVAVAVASALLSLAGVDRPTVLVAATGPDSGRPAVVDEPSVRVGLLVLADGAAAHGPSAPGREDPRSADVDRRLTTALAAGRPDSLAAAVGSTPDPDPAELLARVDALAVLAAWTADHPPQQASLLAYDAPFGVGYLVATWNWTDPLAGGGTSGAAGR